MSAPVRRVALGAADVEAMRRDDGAVFLRSPHVLGPYPRNLTERLERWARETPGEIFVAQRDLGGGWRKMTYEVAYASVRHIGEALLERGLSAERPLAILSENSLHHLLLTLGALHVGVPCAPVSPAYSLLSADHAKLRQIMALATPGLVYAEDPVRYAKAVDAAVPHGTEVLYLGLPEATPSARVDEAHARTGPDGVFVATKAGLATPSHYSFGQTAGLLKAPAEFLRRLGKAGQHELVARNLQTALALREKDGNGGVKVMLTDSEDGESTALAALTSPTYGRIWDADVVAAVRRALYLD